jgi:succinate dehydrogenase/fumarate reductase cytochrome b subunit
MRQGEIKQVEGGETAYWTWHMAAGVAIFALLGLHMTTMHLGGLTGLFVAYPTEQAVSPANSHARDASLFLTVVYILLLSLGLYHGLYGLRTMLFELTLKPATEQAVTAVLVVVGLLLLGFGTWAAVAAHQGAAYHIAAPAAVYVRG